VAAIALAAGVLVGAQQHTATSAPHAVVHGPGFFARIARLGGRGPGSFAAAEKAAETAGIDRTLAYTPLVRIAGAQHREIALTFDDGPGPYTLHMLRVLRHLHAPATFFEVGIVTRDFHSATSRLVADGYPIGDHTESHAPMSSLPAGAQEAQISQAAAALGQYGVTYPRLFRPPYGLYNNTTLALLHKYRMLMVMWTVDTSDYTQPGVNAIVHRAVSGARPGAIILMHDAGGPRAQTIAAVPRIVKALRARGYKIVSVPKLLLDNPPPRDQQIGSVLAGGG